MNTILSIIVLSAIVFGFIKLYHIYVSPTQNSYDDIYFNNVCNSVHKLTEMVEQLEQLEEIITDIQTCSSKNLKGVRIIVPSILGKENEHDMVIDGQDMTSKQLLAITLSERKKLRTSLRNAISELYRNGVTETNTENDSNIVGEDTNG